MNDAIKTSDDLIRHMKEALGEDKGKVGTFYNDKRKTFRRFKFYLPHVNRISVGCNQRTLRHERKLSADLRA